MKKLLLVFAMFAGTTFSATAQVQQGSILVDMYYGMPNLYKSTFQGLVSASDAINVQSGGIGPLGVRAEWLAAEKFGVGIDVCYSDAYVTEDAMGSDGMMYSYEIRSPKIGIMATMNYHFVTTETVDFYFIAGGGYKNRTLTSTTDDPNYTSDSIDLSVLNVAARIGVGARIFFTENIGINLGVGFGQGSIFNGGLSLKF
jgi:opacity protein-like surface antigen